MNDNLTVTIRTVFDDLHTRDVRVSRNIFSEEYLGMARNYFKDAHERGYSVEAAVNLTRRLLVQGEGELAHRVLRALFA